MSTTYIAGYDGSEAGRAAVRFAARLGGATGARVVAATVHPVAPHIAGKGAADGAEAEITAEARHEAVELLAALEASGIERAPVASSSPARGLHQLAEDREASLLAVGTTHHRAAGRLVPGSVGERLVHGAPCPVAVVPRGWDEEDEIRTVGVAYDGREESKGALRAAEHLARRLGAQLVILSVYEPVLSSYVAPGVPVSTWDFDQELRDELEAEVREVAAGLPEELRTTTRVLSGPPARTLAEAADDAIDVLVCGSRGYGPVRSVIVGGVSRYLVDHAPCPVLVVPRDVRIGVDTKPLAAAVTDVA